ncbi:polysaccharide pyruvyl transferase family protein [Motilimonas eburnea]|uniref:polysaccharide pyruvyl transferase family protein n=1 Tax=Motilimonas eburnea TaxID=1737488 RepID=UPI001E39FD1C|nr:polysaccharide pyruvyl transferase family protein [Motilimonas eburnea]MCE2572205.1 polysaccharide pyruvyl transferase family protein [Motilimonas eburnea]
MKQVYQDWLIRTHHLLHVSLPLWLASFNTKANHNLETHTLIFPADPQNPLGSMGDQAIFLGLIQLLRQQGNHKISILCYRTPKQDWPEVEFIQISPSFSGSAEFAKQLANATQYVFTGADVVDGKYGARFVCQALSFAQFAVIQQKSAIITGFSFNTRPRQIIINALNRLSKAVAIHVRDPDSLQRFQHVCQHPANLVADTAFSMAKAKLLPPEVEDWLAKVAKQNQLPVGININRHAFKAAVKRLGQQAFVDQVAAQLQNLAQHHPLAYCFIVHDYKAQAGDVELLTELEQCLQQGLPQGLQQADSGITSLLLMSHQPAEIKAVCAKLSLVISARMHLAIASLGAGTPVLVVDYQDKFTGLLRHFELNEQAILSPDEFLSPKLQQQVAQQLDQLEQSRNQIEQHLPQVMTLSARNLASGPSQQAMAVSRARSG